MLNLSFSFSFSIIISVCTIAALRLCLTYSVFMYDVSVSLFHSQCVFEFEFECAQVCVIFFFHWIHAAYVIAMCAQNVSKPYSNKMVFKVAQQHTHTTRQHNRVHVFYIIFLDIFLLLISFSLSSSFFGGGDGGGNGVLCCVITFSSHSMWQLLSIHKLRVRTHKTMKQMICILCLVYVRVRVRK